MTSPRLVVTVGIASLAAAAFGAAPGGSHHRNVSMRTDGPIADCGALHVTFDDRDAEVQAEDHTITRGEAPILRVRANENGGMQIQGWDKDVYSVSLCKAAAHDSQTLLSQVKLSVQHGEVTVAGMPRGNDVTAFLLVRAPKAAALDLEVDNGPLALYRVDGKVTARATNGPVSAEGCSGEIDLSTENGPVSSEDNRGKLRLRAENGPIGVDLDGDTWNGSGLDAHAENGPVTLRIPHGYKSAVVVESDGNGPFHCSSICSEGRKTWDDRKKRVEFGSGPTMVRVSVVNGPISVD